MLYHITFIQSTFAATCATIVSGAIAERCHFNGYIIICSMVTSVAYPIAAHWCWGPGGWLYENGFRDFAGAGVVHLSGGIIALVGEYKKSVDQKIKKVQGKKKTRESIS